MRRGQFLPLTYPRRWRYYQRAPFLAKVGDFSLSDAYLARRIGEMFTDDAIAAHAAGSVVGLAMRARKGDYGQWSSRPYRVTLPLNRLREILYQTTRLSGVTFEVLKTTRVVDYTIQNGRTKKRRIRVYIIAAKPH